MTRKGDNRRKEGMKKEWSKKKGRRIARLRLTGRTTERAKQGKEGG